MTITITGFASDDKRPGSFRETVYGAGRGAIGAIAKKVLCVGLKATGLGTMTADQDVLQVVSEDDAVAKCGVHGEITAMAIAALNTAGDSGPEIWVAPCAAADGAAAAALTIAVAVTTAVAGTIYMCLGGLSTSCGVAAGDADTAIATNIAAAINGLGNSCLCEATVSDDDVTITAKFAGVRGDQILFWWDSSDVGGVTLTIAGGTPLHANLVPLTGGSGADSVANVLAILEGGQYDVIISPNDATNADRVKDHMVSEAGPGISHLEHAIWTAFGDSAAAISLAQTSLNDERCAVLCFENTEMYPGCVAAVAGVLRAQYSQQNPNYKWAGVVLPGVPGHRYRNDIPGAATQKALLNSGVTPLLTAINGDVYIQRGIVTHCLDGTSPDYKTLDWADADVPDRINAEVGALWDSVSEANQYADDNPGAEDPAAPAGVITPDFWNAEVTRLLRQRESDNWVTDVSDNLPQSEWDSDRKCIMSIIPTKVRPKSFQLGASIRQTS